MDARAYLATLVGDDIHTLTGRPNRVLRIDGNNVIVATERSPEGNPVPVAAVQKALDMLERDGEVAIDSKTVGRRSAFVGAVLATLPGATTALRPRRITRPRPGDPASS